MEAYDDDLTRFEAEGAAGLPETGEQGYLKHEGARIWYAAYGAAAADAPAIACMPLRYWRVLMKGQGKPGTLMNDRHSAIRPTGVAAYLAATAPEKG